MNEKRQILKDAAVKITGDRITEIGSRENLIASTPGFPLSAVKTLWLYPD